MEPTSSYVLIADDVEQNIQVLKFGLQTHGYRVITTNSGEEALHIAQESPPDIIVLDIVMPDIDGYEVCRRLKIEPRLKDIAVIFASALSESIDKVKGLSLGAIDYLTKPYDFDEVLARISTHLTLYHQHKQIQDLLVQRTLAEAAEREQRMMVDALLSSAIALSSTLEFEEVLKRILQNVGQVVPHDLALIILIEGDMGRIASFQSSIERPWAVNSFMFPVKGIDVIWEMERTGQPYLISDTKDDPLWLDIPVLAEMRSFVGAPIFIDGQMIGVFTLMMTLPGFYSENSAQRLNAFVVLASLAVKNAQLYQQAKELAVINERQRLARELHDSVSQTLFSINAIAESLARTVTPESEKASTYLKQLPILTKDVMVEMRSLLFELHPTALVQTELNILMKQICDVFTARTQIPVTLYSPKGLYFPKKAASFLSYSSGSA